MIKVLTIFIIGLWHLGYVLGSDKKGCLLIDQVFPESIYPSHACWNCYENLIKEGRLIKVGCKIEHDKQNYTVPGFVVGSECVPFDHRDKSISKLVQSSLTNSTYDKWLRCCNNAILCCEPMIRNYQVENFLNSCDGHWDGTSCYLDTHPGMTVRKLCPFHMTKDDNSKCHHFYTKHCQSNGSWSQTDYSECFENKRLQSDTIWHVAILGVSLIFCLPPMFVFVINKSLRSKSLMMILGLIMAIGCRNLLILLSKSIITLNHLTTSGPTIVDLNLWPCKVFSFFVELTGNFVYLVLMLLAFYLNQIMTANFHHENSSKWFKKLMYSGFIASIGSTVVWALVMEFDSDKSCWITESQNHWISDGGKLLMLLVTMTFLIHIIWYQSGDLKSHDTLFTTKLIIFSFPAFWLPFIIILIDSLKNSCGLEEVNKFLMIICEAFQAVLISIIFVLEPSVRKAIQQVFKRKLSSQESDASLAASGLSRSSISKDNFNEPMSDWNQVVARARNSICGDGYSISSTIEPQSPMSISPEPQLNKHRFSIVLPSAFKTNPDTTRRSTIRDIMLRAKNNLPRNGSVSLGSSSEKCVSAPPPLPKNIPNQILDDVQLFDFYYKNLDSVFIGNDMSSRPNMPGYGQQEPEKKSSITKFRRMISFPSDKHSNPRKLSGTLCDDEHNHSTLFDEKYNKPVST